jgi:hypothetical protein
MTRGNAARIFAPAGLAALFLLAGCQVSGTTSQSLPPSQSPIVVAVSPSIGSVQTGMSLQFTASVQGDPANKGVTWSIQSSPGCDCGTIDSTGKYSAPNMPHTAQGVVIAATSVSDPTKSGTATVYVTPAPSIAVTVSPASGSVQAGMSLQFTAYVQGDSANKGVTWSIQSPSGCDCGAIDSTGKYFAPKTPHTAPGVVISATSVSDPTKSATAIVLVTPAPIVVTVSPGDGSVQVGMSFQFTATVQGDPTNQGVTWAVESPPGCDCGTIDSTGKYFAGKTDHDFYGGLYITATSVSDPTKSATAVIFVTPAPEGISVSPTVTWVPVNGVQQFSATATPFLSLPAVTWAVSGNGCGASGCGTIDASGKYTAPATAPAPPNVRISATSVADPSLAGFASVTVGNPASNPNNAKLNGHYAFLLKGYNGDGDMTQAGSFVADGQGNISSGITDYAFGSDIERVPGVTFAGTYSVNSDNRTSITFTNTGFLTQTFTLALGSFNGGVASRGRMIELDNEEIWVTGQLAKQDPTAFSAAAVAGSYAFGFGGSAESGWPLTTAGRFTAAGGGITAGLADVYGVGLTESGAGTVYPESRLPFTGLYDVSSNGRGTAILYGLPYSNFSFYVVSADELFFIELETCSNICSDKSGISGTALRQSGGPFSAASLNGRPSSI